MKAQTNDLSTRLRSFFDRFCVFVKEKWKFEQVYGPSRRRPQLAKKGGDYLQKRTDQASSIKHLI